MSRIWPLAFTSLIWVSSLCLAAPADPLAVIPTHALGVAIVNNLADANARILKLTQTMQLPVPGLLPMVQLATGIQEGVDYQGTLAIAAFRDEDSAWGMTLAFFVPASDYKALVGQLHPDESTGTITEVTVAGDDYLAAQRGDFAVFVDEDHRQTLEQILKSTNNLDGYVEPLRTWLSLQQAAIVLSPTGKQWLIEKTQGLLDSLTALGEAEEKDDSNGNKAEDGEAKDKQEGDEKDGQSESDDDDDDSPDGAMAPSPFAPLARFAEVLKDLLAGVESQVTHLALGVRIDDQTSFHLDLRALFKDDGDLAEWAAQVKAPPEGLLAGLPKSKFVLAYGAVTPNSSPLVSKLIGLLTDTGMQQLGLGKEQREKYAAIVEEQRKGQLYSRGMMGTLRPGDSIATTSLTVETVTNSAKHMQHAREAYGVLKDIQLPGKKANEPMYEINDATLGDLQGIEITMNMGALVAANANNDEAAEQVQGLFGKMFGQGGVMRLYMVAADEHTVVSAYSKELLAQGVKLARSKAPGLETDPQITSTAALLPKGAQWALYLSPQGLVQWIDAMLREVFPPETNFKIPPFPPSDAIGLAAEVSATGLDAEIVLPSTVVAGIGQYIGLLQQMMQGNEGVLP